MDGLKSEPLRTISKPREQETVADDADKHAAITNVEHVASYSWVDVDAPTIAVPGSPRLWAPPSLPVTVPADEGRGFIDQNGFRLEKHALVPLFAAADACGAALDWGTVDVVTDRNNLLKLLSWIAPGCAKSKHRSGFRIDVALAGTRTLLMRRWEARPVVYGSRGYGDGFERAFSRGVLGSSVRGTLAGHNRVVSYDFDGLRIVVRYEVDAYHVPAQSPVDALAGQLSTLAVAPAPDNSAPDVSAIVGVERAGEIIPQTSLVKMKSRSRTSKSQFLEAAYLQLHLGQIPAICIGVHDGKGTFNMVDILSYHSERFYTAREKARAPLRRLRRLLEDIRDVIKERGPDVQLSLVFREGELLLMQRGDDDAILPPALLRRFKNEV